MASPKTPTFLLIGKLEREYIITASGKSVVDQAGGNLLYAAGGLALWGKNTGLVSRVGENYPEGWLSNFHKLGFNTEGIKILAGDYDLRRFIAYSDLNTKTEDDPAVYFSKLGQSFPKSLLGYKKPVESLDEKKQINPLDVRPMDIPHSYEFANAAHLCPMSFLSHSLLPAELRKAGLTILTLDPGSNYMDPVFMDEMPSLLQGLTAFLPSEQELYPLFRKFSTDLWEIAETLASFGCEIIVIKRGIEGQYLYDARAKARYDIPAYPSNKRDATGAGDAFCGGFLAGYKETFDPLQAVLYGNISSSLTIEGSGPFYAQQSMPELVKMRLEKVAEGVRRI
ncbi:MAG: carbohydrate kinase family protein [Anaerolineales bacterium]|nr:carbohydrate kinase family protein [Anaerolineales bacterium]